MLTTYDESDLQMPTDDEVKRYEYEQFIRMYEARHAELRIQIKEIEVNNRKDIQEIANSVAKLRIELTRKSIDVWKVISMSILTGVVGYIAATLQHIFLH